jgi:hypothetical protein
MAADVESLVHEYARRYSARDVEGVTELCLWPFLAIRGGSAIHLEDRVAVRDHFMSMIDAYRDAGYASFAPVAIDTHELGEHAAFTTVRWRALDANGTLPAIRRPRTTCSPPRKGGACFPTPTTSSGTDLRLSSLGYLAPAPR